MATETPTQRLASLVLGQPLAEFVAVRRAKNRSWPSIAYDLALETRGEIRVTSQSLRTWYKEDAS